MIGLKKNVFAHKPSEKGPREKQKQAQRQNRTLARKDSGNNGQGQLERLVHLHDRIYCRESKICCFKTNISTSIWQPKG